MADQYPPTNADGKYVCLHCGQPLRTQVQRFARQPDLTMVDCLNKDCLLNMVTASVGSYRQTAQPFLDGKGTNWQARLRGG